MTLKLCVALLLVAATPIGGNESLRLSVFPQMATQPAVVNVRVSIEPDDENRAIQIIAESADYFRSSQVQLDGTNATRTSTFQYRDLPAGEYAVRGTLIGRDGHQRAVAIGRLVVMP